MKAAQQLDGLTQIRELFATRNAHVELGWPNIWKGIEQPAWYTA